MLGLEFSSALRMHWSVFNNYAHGNRRIGSIDHIPSVFGHATKPWLLGAPRPTNSPTLHQTSDVQSMHGKEYAGLCTPLGLLPYIIVSIHAYHTWLLAEVLVVSVVALLSLRGVSKPVVPAHPKGTMKLLYNICVEQRNQDRCRHRRRTFHWGQLLVLLPTDTKSPLPPTES